MLRINKRVVDDVAVIAVKSKLTLPDAQQFREFFEEVLQEGHGGILISLKETPFCDSSGIGELINAYSAAKGKKCKYAILPSLRVSQVLIGPRWLDFILDPSMDEERALEALKSL